MKHKISQTSNIIMSNISNVEAFYDCSAPADWNICSQTTMLQCFDFYDNLILK